VEIYVITSGSYSDYGIIRIFTDKVKAELYVKLNPYARGDSTELQTWQTDDDTLFEQVRYVTVDYSVYDTGHINYGFSLTSSTTLDSEVADMEYIYRDENGIKRTLLYLVRKVDNSTDGDILEERYKRVCEDLYAQIRSLIDTEGWTEEMVDKWLADKGRLE
jgi:hypothetical protein